MANKRANRIGMRRRTQTGSEDRFIRQIHLILIEERSLNLIELIPGTLIVK